MRRWTTRRLLTVFAQVCDALAFAHDRGVLHRVLKPPTSCPTDVSVDGVEDMASGERDCCEDVRFQRKQGAKPVCGGSWAADRRTCRCANRPERAPWVVISGFGFRLVRAAPRG